MVASAPCIPAINDSMGGYELNYIESNRIELDGLTIYVLANEFDHQINSIRGKANSNCSGFPYFDFNCHRYPVHMPSISISGIDFCFEFVPDSRTLPPYRLHVERHRNPL